MLPPRSYECGYNLSRKCDGDDVAGVAGFVVGAKFGTLSRTIGPAQVLSPPVFRSAPVPVPRGPSGVPDPDRISFS